MTERLTRQLAFLTEVDQLKNILRQSLVMDKSRRENDAEHSWHIALMALTLHEYAASDQVDLHRVLQMALLHDLVEIDAGDTFAYDTAGYRDKAAREQAAADRLFSLLPPDQARHFRSLWEEFDRMETADALYASAIDRLQPLLANHQTDGHTWTAHGGISASQVRQRMAPVRAALPALWAVVEAIIADACAKGYLLADPDPVD